MCVCVCVCMCMCVREEERGYKVQKRKRKNTVHKCVSTYGVALVSRIDKITGLSCKRAL